jgi:hypothetical protein
VKTRRRTADDVGATNEVRQGLGLYCRDTSASCQVLRQRKYPAVPKTQGLRSKHAQDNAHPAPKPSQQLECQTEMPSDHQSALLWLSSTHKDKHVTPGPPPWWPKGGIQGGYGILKRAGSADMIGSLDAAAPRSFGLVISGQTVHSLCCLPAWNTNTPSATLFRSCLSSSRAKTSKIRSQRGSGHVMPCPNPDGVLILAHWSAVYTTTKY